METSCISYNSSTRGLTTKIFIRGDFNCSTEYGSSGQCVNKRVSRKDSNRDLPMLLIISLLILRALNALADRLHRILSSHLHSYQKNSPMNVLIDRQVLVRIWRVEIIVRPAAIWWVQAILIGMLVCIMTDMRQETPPLLRLSRRCFVHRPCKPPA